MSSLRSSDAAAADGTKRPRGVNKHATRLADGRELIYFDDRPGRNRSDLEDTRALPQHMSRSEARYDALSGEWVIVATHRQDRTHLPPANECPLCPSGDGYATEVPASDYDVVVFENRFPSLTPAHTWNRPHASDGHTKPGVGRCEVMCFTSDHEASFATLSADRARTVIDAWADRTATLSKLEGVEQVFPFENRGQAIGVTLHHPHGQIYGYPFVTPATRRMIEIAETHHHRTGRNIYDDVLEAEQRGTRVVGSSDHWLAFVPHAARWPFEVHVVPRRHVPDFAQLTDAERNQLASLYLDVLGRLDRLHDEPMPYIAAWYQAPVHVGRELTRLHARICSVRRAPGKLKHLAGSEAAMGVFINDIAPEDAASALRDA